MGLTHLILYVALPAIAAGLLFAVVLGWRLVGLAFAAAAVLPFALLRALPAAPWDLWRHPAPPAAWHLWIVVGAGLVGSLRDLRVLPRSLGDLLGAGLLLVQPWLLLAGLRGVSADAAFVPLLTCCGIAAACWLVLREVVRSELGSPAVVAGALGLLGDLVLLAVVRGVGDATVLVTAVLVLLVAMVASAARASFRFGDGAALAVVAVHVGAILLPFGGDGAGVGFGGDLVLAVLALTAPVPLWLGVRWALRDGADAVDPRPLVLGSGAWFTLLAAAALRWWLSV